MHKWLSLFVMAGVLAIGCGGSGGGSAPNFPTAKVRLLTDFVDVPSVSGKVGGTLALKNQPFANYSAYRDFKAGTLLVSFSNSATSATLVSRTVTLSENQVYTAIGLGSVGAGRHVMFLADSNAPISGQAQVRFLNGDEDAPSVDVYVTPTSTGSLSGLTPDKSSVAFLSEAATYNLYAPGTYSVWFTAAGQPSTVVVKNNVTFTDGQVTSLMAIKASGGTIIQEIPEGPSA